MKSLLTVLALTGLLCGVPVPASAESGHDHGRVGGPKGGRLLDDTAPKAEFFVEKDRTVTITFYDEALKPVAVAKQTVTVIAETEGVKSTVEFEKKGDALFSKGPLPEAHALNLVVQFRQTAESKPVNFRFVVENHICGECKRAEYACICEH